jgi:dihydroflavonol-4-reductase
LTPNQPFWSGKRVCVTGGTGLLGYQIVKRLVDMNACVRVLASRFHDRHPIRRAASVELIEGDVRDAPTVIRALGGCDVVFHTAGVVAVWGPALEAMRDVQVIGARNVLDAAPNGARVVVTSSVVTVGASQTAEPLDEDVRFGLGEIAIDYVHAKRAAESIALDRAAGGRDVVVTNPGYLVGPEDFERSVMGRFCARYWRGQIPLAPPGGFNLVDVRDVAIGHMLAAERGRSGRRYILGGENRTFPEFMRLLAQAGGMRPRSIPVVPMWTLFALAAGAEARSLLTHKHPYPSLQHSRLNRYYWFYRSDRAARELGFAPRPLAETLLDTYRWYSAERDLTVRGLSRWWMRPE